MEDTSFNQIIDKYDTSYAPNDFPPIVPNRETRRKQEKNKSNSNVKSSIGVIGHISNKNKNKDNFNKFLKRVNK